MMLVLAVVTAPGLFQLAVTGGVLAEIGVEGPSRMGVLILGQVTLVACGAVMVPTLLARILVLDREGDALRAHPGFLPEVVIFRVVAAILATSMFLSVFFLLFHGHLMWSQAGERWSGFAVHVVVLPVYLGLLGLPVAEGTRRFLAGPGAARRARSIRRHSVVPFFLLFPGLVGIPVLVHRYAPSWLADVGRAAPDLLFFLQAPVALSAAWSRGDPRVAGAWILGIGAAAAIGALCLRRWLKLTADRLAVAEEGGVEHRSFRAFRIRGARGTWVRTACLFWSKDVYIPLVRRPAAYIQLHGSLLALAVLLLLVTGRVEAGARATDPAGLSVQVGVSETILVVSAFLAMAGSLGSLGSEGRGLALLRPALAPARLLVLKWAVHGTYTLLHIPLYALALGLLGGRTGPSSSGLFTLLALGMAAGLVFSLLGTGLGFLFPDFRCRSPVIPGSSRSSQILFGALAAATIVGTAVRAERSGSGAERIDAPAFFGPDGLALFLCAAVAAAASVWAVRRFDRLEVA